jgi:uncharacterized Zn-finger protein
MIKRQNLKILKNHETSASCDGDKDSGRHPKIFLTLKDGSAECYYCGKLFVTEDTHDKYLNKARKNFKKNKNVQKKRDY